MIGPEVGKKYGVALFRAAQKQNQIEEIFDNLKNIIVLKEKNIRFIEFLENPRIRDKDKKDFIKSLSEGRVPDLLVSLLILLLDKNRIKYLPEIFSEYQRLYKEDQGIVEAEVITAFPLDHFLTGRLKEKLEKKTGKRLEMITKVDPFILGGVVVKMGDRIVDKSIRYQLNQIKELVTEVRVY
jgi:F-type H+-transporting ATPase subunit delta